MRYAKVLSKCILGVVTHLLTPLALQASTGLGDSGGPLFADFNGVSLVVGTLNGSASEIPGGNDSEYGDVSDWAALAVGLGRTLRRVIEN